MKKLYEVNFNFTADIEAESERDALNTATYSLDHSWTKNMREITLRSTGAVKEFEKESVDG